MRNTLALFAAAAMVAAASAADISPSTVNLRVNSPRSNALCLGSKMLKEAIAMERLRGGGGKLKVAFLTAGGLAPCLSSSIGYLIEIYNEYDPEIEIIGYVDGYKGLLKGEYVKVTPEVRRLAPVFVASGGSPIGNSRVKLTNIKDCVKRGLVKEGQDPQKVAADQLVKDGVTVLHTIGGDDTNTAAADLAAFLKRNNYALTVVGLPKTIDNDVYPIKLSLGAMTAAQQGAIFYENVVNEHSANPRMLIVHEVMGRHSGWLTAATAKTYRERLVSRNYVPQLGLNEKCKDVHAIYVPEMSIDLDAEAARLTRIMDEVGNVNIFISEGAGTDEIIKRMEAAGQTVPRDAFGHPKLDAVNAGKFFADQLGEKIRAEKTLVQKSGYFARSAAPNDEDRALIKRCCHKAVESALLGQSGVVGQDEDTPNLELRAIEFERIAGGKPFCVREGWFQQTLKEIGQPFTPAVGGHHEGNHIEHPSFEDELRKKLSLAGKA